MRPIITAGLALGIGGDILLRSGFTGIGFTIWALASIGALYLIARDYRSAPALEWVLLLSTAGVIATLPLWRDAEMIAFLTVIALASLALITVTTARGYPFRSIGNAAPAEVIIAGFHGAIGTIAGGATLLAGAANDQRRAGSAGKIPAIARGVALAIPPLIVFTALFASADPTFEALGDSLRVNFGDVVSHVALASFLAWMTAGALRYATSGAPAQPISNIPFVGVGATEVAIVLGALDLLFTIFVAIQLPRMFGGEAFVMQETGLTFAQYARRGFFELVTASGLALGVLILAQAFARTTADAQRMVRLLGGLMVALVLVILQSAVHRLALYIQQFGWTVDRLYASAVIVWLGVTLGWALTTLLARRVKRFAAGALTAGIAVLIALAAMNAEALAVRLNAARTIDRNPFDFKYAASQGRDAAPALAAALPSLPNDIALNVDDCRALGSYLWNIRPPEKWRRWTWSALEARDAWPTIHQWTAVRCAGDVAPPTLQEITAGRAAGRSGPRHR